MAKTKVLVLLAAAAVCSGLAGGTAYAGPNPAAPAEGNTGGFFAISPDTTDADLAERVAEHAAQIHTRTPANNLCTGTWNHAVSAVQFQRASGGTLAWGFWFTTAAKAALGPTATVSMPYAYINGTAINPPYSPHTQGTGYNFHGSLNRYNYIGGGGGSLQTGQKVTFYWYAKGAKPGSAADRYITCQVPTPGSA